VTNVVEIQGHRIGAGEVYVLSEIGANFFSRDEATALIDLSATGGAHAVKVQTFRGETLSAEGAMFTFEDGSRVSQREYWRTREISEEMHADLKSYASRSGMAFFSTPSHYTDVELLERVGVPAYKIGSDDLTNVPFIQYIARIGKPVILSTGMSTLAEIADAVEAFYGTGNDQLILLHCLVGYPAPASDANLRMIETLQRAFGCPVGFSDHTPGHLAASVAVALGAALVERHVTVAPERGGPDDLVALDAAGFAEYVRAVRLVSTMLGDGIKRIMPGEMKWREAGRKSIVTSAAIAAGEALTADNITLKRPATGLHPRLFPVVLGATATRNLAEDEAISLNDLAWR
jgi:sialic acid synthase SpsE